VKRWWCWILLLLLSVPLWAGGPRLHYQKGVEAYREHRWSDAAAEFQAVLDQGVEAGDVYYNLGNCYYRLNDVPHAVLYYEKALRLMPFDADLRSNLETVRTFVADQPTATVKLPVWQWVDRILELLSPNSWSLLMLVMTWLWSLFLVLQLVRRRPWTRLLHRTMLGLLLFSGLLFSLRLWREHHEIYGVVMTAKVVVRSAPDSSATELFDLHGGVKFQIMDRLQQWWRVRLPDGNDGWMPARAGEKI